MTGRGIAVVALFTLLGPALGLGCAPSLPDAYLRSRAAAERAYSAGRYDEAAREWQAAAASADRPSHRNEARYRAAVSLRRAGRWAEATRAYEELGRASPGSSRAARAAFDRAEIELLHGDAARGLAMLQSVVRDHPDSAAGSTAVRRVVIALESSGDPQAVRAWLEAQITALEERAVGEALHYSMARWFEQKGQLAAARDRYLFVASKYPYPQGALWDDALFHAAELEEKLGNPRAAIANLERMLEERESSHFQGSYERPRFAQARYHIAEIYRDRLGDARRARVQFARVWSEHPTSLLRDDARWNEALLASRMGDSGSACQVLESLMKGSPDSRYAPCAPLVCSTLKAPPKRVCHAYIARSLKGPSAGG